MPVGPEPERDYAWNDRIAEVRELWGNQSGISPEQQQVVVDILIGFRELSDDPDEYDTYEGLTRMLRAISTIADPMDDVEWILRRVGEWLHEQLPEVCFCSAENLTPMADHGVGRIYRIRRRRGSDR